MVRVPQLHWRMGSPHPGRRARRLLHQVILQQDLLSGLQALVHRLDAGASSIVAPVAV